MTGSTMNEPRSTGPRPAPAGEGDALGVPADQAHDMVLETCGLSAQLEDGILLIDYRPTR